MSIMYIRQLAKQTVRAVAVLSVLFLMACGPADVGKKRLKPIHRGMGLDSVALITGKGPLVAATEFEQPMIQNGFRTQRFFTNGTLYTVMWYRETPGKAEDAITRETQTPIVMQADTVLGWGWRYYIKLAKKLSFPNPLEDTTQADQ